MEDDCGGWKDETGKQLMAKDDLEWCLSVSMRKLVGMGSVWRGIQLRTRRIGAAGESADLERLRCCS